MNKFFTFIQNNSGGVFLNNESVAEHVIIEAENYEEANSKAEEIGIYFDGCRKNIDCNCCGDRWDEADEDDGYEKPSIYGVYYKDYKSSFFNKGCIVYYANGKSERYEFKKERRDKQ